MPKNRIYDSGMQLSLQSGNSSLSSKVLDERVVEVEEVSNLHPEVVCQVVRHGVTWPHEEPGHRLGQAKIARSNASTDGSPAEDAPLVTRHPEPLSLLGSLQPRS